jgi:chromosome segregation ATPase|tara:strand:- start:1417 stop:1752 length:336 start_codon:yes stop_codon:yes gene_type:complete
MFKELTKKIDLIKEATSTDNNINNLEIKLNGVLEKEKKANKRLLNKIKKIDGIKSKLLDLNKLEKKITSEVKSLKTKIIEKESNFSTLKQKWDELDIQERELRKYFSELSL